jgi:uncharacterized protein (DUF58 family)
MASSIQRQHIAFRRHRSVKLTWRGRLFAIATLGLFAFAYAEENRVLLMIGVLTGTLFVAGVLLAAFRAVTLEVRRTFSPVPVTAQSDATVTVEVLNGTAIVSAPSYWNDTIPWRPLATQPAATPRLRPKRARRKAESATMSYTLRPPRRGAFEIGPLLLAYSDPFGMAVSFSSMGKRDPLIVTPHVVELPDSGVWLEAPDGAARLVQLTGVGNADDLMTREYRRGDALRRVHWRASARHGELMVRQEEQRAYPEATIAIDTRAIGYPDLEEAAPPEPATSEYFEWAVTMLASLGVHLHRAGFVVHIAESGETQVVPLADEDARQSREDDFLLSLASVDLITDGGAKMAAANGPVFAIVSDPDEQTLRWLLGLRRPYELGVAFVVGADIAVASRFVDAGWRVVPTDEATDPAAAWSALVDELGSSRVGA